MNRFILISALWLCAGALYAGDKLFSIDDPRGDDFGNGALSYPSGADFERGDLDLLNFSAEHDKDGTWFEVRFAGKVRSPKTRTSKMGNVPLDEIARHDFYNLNVDVYIDTDGYEGSGRTDTLPGRRIRVADGTAWDKAVILTPRPRMAQAWMEKQRAEELGGDAAAKDAAEAEITRTYSFSDRIRVSGRSIRWFVPDSFLGGPADPSWRYVVIVTGADPEQKMDISFFKQKNTGLFMMPLNSGRPFETFQLDYDANPNLTPVVDVLLPTVDMQRELLSAVNAEDGNRAILGGLRAGGMSKGEGAGAVMKTLLPKPKVAAAEPASAPPAHEPAKPLVPAPPAHADHDHAAHAPKPPADPHAGHDHAGHDHAAHDARGHAGDDAPVIAPPLPMAPTTPTPPPAKSVAERLRELLALRKDGLITEAEYNALRQKILDSL